ncbi:MAG: class I SAM-dependent methyltransferase [Candidatus Methanoperedens sp.]|nr:class I SAM-dependent methyltransferase [Candidatus Methanoperedens sp.]
MIELYRDPGLKIYEKSHYSHREHIIEVKQILSWYRCRRAHILDIGCSGGLHAIEFAKKGHSVIGLDIEPSAVELARRRSRNANNGVKFRVMDIGRGDLSALGRFDLIYSIGNVLSHVRKDSLPEILRKVRGSLNEDGIILFDVLINAKPFQEEIHPGKNGFQIIWRRNIDGGTGKISMDGTFLEYGFTQHFDVWGYTVEEIEGLLGSSGFSDIEFSEALDFTAKNKSKNPISLYFRAKAQGDI